MSLGADRELDALHLIAACLRAGDTVAEIGPCVHSLKACDELADDVQVCSEAARLGSLASLSWLRLASSAELGESVQQAIRRHRPRILLGTGPGESVEELPAMLAAPGYCATARVGDFLFLAPVTDCEPLVATGSGRFSDPLRTALAGAQGVVNTALRVVRLERRDGPYNTIWNAARQYRPATVRSRKLKKLLTDPRRFFDDAKSPLLHGPAANLLALVPSRTRVSRRETTRADFPKRSILVFLAAGERLDTEAWSRLCTPLTLSTEIVVVADASQHGALEGLLTDAICPRIRVYLVAGPASGQTLLDYGIARCYASNLAIVRELGLHSADAISDAFAELRDDRPYLIAEQAALIVTKRARIRDQASPELASAELEAALAEMASQIPPSEHSTLSVLDGDERFFGYPTLAPKDCFSERAHPRVFCMEKRPNWSYPGSKAAREQRVKVSVIMTVYNAAKTLPAAIASVLNQSYQNLELLVIDDGSDDGSLEILLALAKTDARLCVLQTANNSGTYFAKNVGLSFAQGDYVTFHDSDDISAGNRLELQVEALDCDPLAIANYTRYQRVSEEGREVWFGGNTNRPGYITLLFRREQVLAAVGYFDSVRMSADAELVNRLRLATQRPVRLLPFVSYYALQAEGSLTTAGAGAFAMASDGKMNMPPVRQSYREAADAWHGACYEDRRLAHIPFPLGRRPFEAPFAMLPDRGYSGLAERLLALTLASEDLDLTAELRLELESHGEDRFGAKVLTAIEGLAERKRVRDCRRLFLGAVHAMEQLHPQSGLEFADKNLSVAGDAKSAAAIARMYADQGCIVRALDVFRQHVPNGRRGPLYARLESNMRVLAEGIEAISASTQVSQKARTRHVLYHVNQSLPFHPNGYALRTKYLLLALQKEGWQPCVVTRFGYPSDRPDFRSTSQVLAGDEIDGVPYIYEPDTQGVRGLTACQQHPLLVQSLAKTAVEQRPSLIHSASNHIVGLAGARVAQQLGIPSVYEMRGLWHMTRSARQPVYEDSDHYRMIERLEVQAAQESDFVFTLTGAMKELLMDAGVSDDKIAVLPNAVDTDHFVVATPPESLARFYQTEGKVVIGFVGSMSDYEGLDLLLEAISGFKERRDFHVLMVGDGPAKHALEILAHRLGLQERISFVGRVAHERVRDYYALIDIVAYPRKSLRVCEYVSPLKPFEALAQEKAVVVSSVRALAEIVEHEQSGLVFDKGDAGALAEALQRLLGDAPLRSRLGKQGRQQVLARHTWQHNAEQLQEVYDRLLGSSAT